MLMVSEARKEFKELAVFTVFVILVSTVLALFALTAFLGAEDPQILDKFTVYYAQTIIFLVGIGALRVIKFLNPQKGIPMSAIIHDPEDSPLGALKETLVLIKNPLILTISLTIIMLIFGLVMNAFNLSFSGLPFVEQQASITSKLIFAVSPAVDAENLMFTFLISLFLLVPRYFVNRFLKSSRLIYHSISLAAIPILVGFLGIGYHLFRYGGQEIALFNTFIFWYAVGFLTILTYSYIPAYLLHVSVNFFQKARELLASDTITIAIFVTILFLGIILVFLLISKRAR